MSRFTSTAALAGVRVGSGQSRGRFCQARRWFRPIGASSTATPRRSLPRSMIIAQTQPQRVIASRGGEPRQRPAYRASTRTMASGREVGSYTIR